ncbi:hypothetical protein [Arcobacter arenosus]|uniref:Uncharacterized protein n=1 Tax=Arcobacter arenosus TaxID=2576037 RepID=A0A5R8Y4R0_9BACT|nr:hypothetical protein [Arcobacter arenosus]TLP41065.1 hypothetical protein FDK22_03325 [Arcobacter arenosus]
MGVYVMSALESHDYDLMKHEERDGMWLAIEEENIAEFREMLEEAFTFANNEKIEQDTIFTELKTIFRAYFDKCDMVISEGYTFEQLTNTLIRGER